MYRKRQPAFRFVAAVHGLYFFFSGLWPLLHMPSFIAVTGPKTDLWLVNTVGLLVAATGITLMLGAICARVSVEIVAVAVLQATVLMGIDIYYVFHEAIPPVYLIDAVVEFLFISMWFMCIFLTRQVRENQE